MSVTAAPRRGSLWRYNYKILVGAGYWVIVLPVAASQVVTLWMMAMSADFSQEIATHIAEMMAPILGAFLVAHSLAPEYRSGIGAVLASKPVSLHRVVSMRAGLAMLAAFLLTTVTLTVCSFSLKRVEIGPPLLAAVPSLGFLSLLALTFATLFRNSLAGFAVAAALWALDLSMGYGVNAFLSLQGYHALLQSDPLAGLWIPGKITLAAGSLVLLFLMGRLVHRVCQPAEGRDINRIAATIAAVLLLYTASGAAATVAYAHRHRGALPTADVVWLRRALKLYGPVPVSRFFGPAFAAYVSEPPLQEGRSDTSQRIRTLEHALQRWPGSIWADGIAFALASEREVLSPQTSAKDYFRVVELFPSSPFAPRALVRIVRADSPEVTGVDRLKASRELVARYPASPEVDRAADFLLSRSEAEVPDAERLEAALKAGKAAPRVRRPTWLVEAAKLQRKAGRTDQAIASAQEAKRQAEALLAEMRAAGGEASEVSPHFATFERARVAAVDLLRELGAG